MAPYLFLGMLTLFACWFFVGRHGVFGATVDWFSQHSVFPDYFRQQFYETGELFPEYAANIGGGQNIYNFSYYGLYNPIILLSYLLPFVKMSDYLMGAGIAGLAVSVWIFYYWLSKRGFSGKVCLTVAVMFLLAGPMIFHSYRQIMFVNYMPFLCLAFLGMDRHFEKRKSGLFTVSVCLMILTSFYFSICGMLVLFLYGVSRCVELKKGYGFVFPMITAVCMSGVLLVPTAFAVLGNRSGGQRIDPLSLFIPELSVTRFAYSSYGIGLTTLVITVLIAGCTYRKWHERILVYGCLIVLILPVFAWALNGGLYVRSKAFIPFLPLLCYLTAVYLRKQEEKEISLPVNLISCAVTLVIVCLEHGQKGLLAESIMLLLFCLLFCRYRRICLLILPSICSLAVYNMELHPASGEMIDREFYHQVTDTRIGDRIAEILEKEPGLYRLEQGGTEEEKSANLNRIWNMGQWISSVYSSAYNADYQQFRRYVFGVEEPFRNDMMQAVSENPLYRKLMGVKYVLKSSGGEDMQQEELQVYENPDAAPVIYVTDKLISEQEYDALTFPYNQTVLMRYAVVKNGWISKEEWGQEQDVNAESTLLEIPEITGEASKIQRLCEDSYHIEAKKEIGITCSVENTGINAGTDAGSEPDEDRLLYVQFQVKNNKPNQDVTVWVDGIRDKLTSESHFYYNDNTVFTYVTRLEAGQSQVEVTFGKGDYDITDIACFLGSGRILKDKTTPEDKLYQARLQVDREQTKGNRIAGELAVKRTGYVITSIPYDSNFEIFVDGKRVVPEKVNKAFLGFAIGKGNRHVELVYHAPGVTQGKALSISGILIFGFVILKQHFRRIST